MKIPISGKLGKISEVKTVETKNGATKVANFTVYVSDPYSPEFERADGSKYKKDIPFSCVAWGELAEELGKRKTGERLTGSYVMKYNERTVNGKTTVEPKYLLKKIDLENTLHNQLSELLSDYEEGTISSIKNQGVTPSFESEQNTPLKDSNQNKALEDDISSEV